MEELIKKIKEIDKKNKRLWRRKQKVYVKRRNGIYKEKMY